ncbi:MAG: transcriptional repressor [Firmicutes bacterium]|nr:transcriptional repressor [Bacillota bacterium]
MENKGFIRKTKQRKAILSVLRSTKIHPTADWIYEEVRKEVPNVSLGTIYRNLKILTEMGEVMELSYGSTYSRFDGNPDNHYHFVCEECGSIFDIDIDIAEKFETKVENKLGVKVTDHRMEFYGLCTECLKSKQESAAK